MDNDRENDSFRTSTDIYGGSDADYDFTYTPNIEEDEVYVSGDEKVPLEEADGQPSDRKKKKKKRRKKHYMLRLIAIVVIIAVCIAVLRSPLFDISVIRVEGNTLLTEAEIIEIAGVSRGMNMFSIRSGRVKASLEKNAYIASAEIDRQIPDTYVITIHEKNPTFAVKYDDGYVIIDDDGTVIDFAKDSQSATLLTGVQLAQYKIGDIPAFKEGCDFALLIDMIQKINASGLYFKKVEVLTPTSVKASITDTLLCQGECVDLSANVEGIKAAVYDLGQRGVKRGVIHVSSTGYASFNPVI